MAPPSSLSPSKKLLITDPKAKSKPKTAPPPPPTSTAEAPGKRIQDQPNLSDCHGCGHRIDRANPKDQLQLLDSIWRIVLLCRDCRKAIRFGRKCPYCFKETAKSGNNLFQCGGCDRKIHDDCVRDFGDSTPWRHLGAGREEFRVCVDCWVPELLKNSFRACMGNQNEDELKGKIGGKKSLGKGVKKGKCKVEKVDKGESIRRPRNGVDLSNVVLALPAMNFKDSARGEHSNRVENLNSAADGVRTQNLNSATDGTRAGNSDSVVRAENLGCGEDGARAENLDDAGDKVEGDAELAFQLHRAMNSSTRISRSKCSVDSNSRDVEGIRDWNGLTYKRHALGRIHVGDQKLESGANNMENEGTGQLEESVLSDDVNGLNSGQASPYKRDKKRKLWQFLDEDTVVLHSDGSGTWSPLKSSANIPESSFDSNAGLSKMLYRSRQEFVGYNRTRFKQKGFQMNGLTSVTGECCSCDNTKMGLKSNNSQSGDAGLGIGFLAKSDAGEHLPSGSSDEKGNCSHAEDSMHYGICESENQACTPALCNSAVGCSRKCREELNIPDQTCNQDSDLYCFKYARRMRGAQDPDPYCFKYAKRMKGSTSGTSETLQHSGTFLSEIEASAAGLTTNYSAESRNVSDVSFDYSTNNLPK